MKAFTFFRRQFLGRFRSQFQRLQPSHPQYKSFTTTPAAPDTLMMNDQCIQQMKKVCSDGSKLRIVVESGGCSGFQYNFDVISSDAEFTVDDICVTHKGMTVVIDEDSLELVRGSTVDYHSELIRSAFRIIGNPNAELGCSCGASFALKN